MWNVKASHLRAQAIGFTGINNTKYREITATAENALKALEANKITGKLMKDLEALPAKV